MPVGVYAHKKGYKISEEHKKKISNSHKGVKLSKEHIESMRQAKLKNPVRYWLGKKRPSPSKATRKKMSDSQIRIGNKPPVRYGKDNNHYIDGRTPENKKARRSIEFRLWRESVFARDGWTCQKCGEIGVELHPHHIKNFAEYIELRFAIDNGITLCKKCHMKFHKIYGTRKNTIKQLEEFLLVDKNIKINNTIK